MLRLPARFHPGHETIHQDEVIVDRFQRLDDLAAIGNHVHLITPILQHSHHDHLDYNVVISHKDLALNTVLTGGIASLYVSRHWCGSWFGKYGCCRRTLLKYSPDCGFLKRWI